MRALDAQIFLLLLTISLIKVIELTEPASLFHITVPSVIYGGKSNVISVHTSQPYANVSVETTANGLTRGIEDGYVYHLGQIYDGHYGVDISYKAPFVLGGSEYASITLKFKILYCVEQTCSIQLREQLDQLVRFENMPTIMLAETDKPLYRPGETVRFRFITFSLNSNQLENDELPSKKLVEKNLRIYQLENLTEQEYITSQTRLYEQIKLSGPNDQVVKRWLNVSLLMAANLSYTLLIDAPEGEWEASAKMFWKTEVLRFSVKQFVLPRFLFSFNLPKHLTFQSKYTQLSVCAKYTNGPSMRGSVSGQLCVCDHVSITAIPENLTERLLTTGKCLTPSWASSVQYEERPCIPISSELSTNGCASFNVSTGSLKLSDFNFRSWNQMVLFCAEVEEEGTGSKVRQCESGKEVSRDEIKLELDIPQVYRKQLPMFGTVRLAIPSQSNPEGRLIKLKAEAFHGGCYREPDTVKSIYIYTENLRTGANGMVNFTIPPTWNENDLDVTVQYDPEDVIENTDASKVVSHGSRVRLSSSPHHNPPYKAYKMINSWVSVGKEVIQVWPSDNAIKVTCPGKVKFILMANVPLASRTIHIQSMVRGNLLNKIVKPTHIKEPCVDQNGTLGHYNCFNDSSNIIECLRGWTGLDCLIPICDASCDPLKGYCTKPGGCSCRSGWSGKTCSVCVKRDGCKHGKCLNGNDCVCDPDWSGYLCDRSQVYIERVNDIQSEATTEDIPLTSTDSIATDQNSSTNLQNISRRTLFTRSISFEIDSDWGPDVTAVVYYYDYASGDIVATTIQWNDALDCTSNAVALESQSDKAGLLFSEKNLNPGEKLTLTISPKGLPRKLSEDFCYIRLSDIALDNFAGLKNKITVQSYANILKSTFYTSHRNFNALRDTYSAFNSAGLKLKSNVEETIIPKRIYPCEIAYMSMDDMGLPGSKAVKTPQRSKVGKPAPRLRDFFPEVWLFDVYPMSKFTNDGLKLNLTAPDSITSWRASAFCTIVNSGPWIPTAQLITVSMPFFVEITLPKQVKRGEIIYIPINAFVLERTTKGNSTPLEDEQDQECYEVSLRTVIDDTAWLRVGTGAYVDCICANEKKTFLLGLMPQRLGQLNLTVEAHANARSAFCNPLKSNSVSSKNDVLADRIRRQVRVIPEGIARETTFGDILCLSNDSASIQREFPVGLPDELVSGSLRVYMSYTDEVLGPALENLDNLVHLPTGCGEQNMVIVAPNVYVLDYLKSVPGSSKQKTDSLIRTARKNIQIGYKNQLNYRRDDGSFSAFGMSDKEGSTWLTAFVLRVFAKARNVESTLPTIDWDKLFNETLQFLVQQQSESTGCFIEKGRVLHSGMQGAITKHDDTTSQRLLTAYVLLALLELQTSNNSSKFTNLQLTIEHGLHCLNHEKLQSDILIMSTYELVQLTYALVVAQPTSLLTERLFSQLMNRKNVKLEPGNTLASSVFWIDTSSSDSNAASSQTAAAVETTSYAYLTLARMNVARSELFPIIRWLSSRQKSNGGFYSTQDTVLALESMTDFAKRLGLSSTTSSVDAFRISATLDGSDFHLNETITQEKKRVLNQFAVPSLNIKSGQTNRWNLSTTKKGAYGCAAVQFSMMYNVPIPHTSNNEAFRVAKTVLQSKTPTKESCKRANLSICVRLPKSERVPIQTGMLLVRVNMVSGWKADEKLIISLIGDNESSVRRLEFDDHDTISLYYDGFSETEAETAGGRNNLKRCAQLVLHQSVYVEAATAAEISIMDYYASQRESSVKYELDGCKGAWITSDLLNEAATTVNPKDSKSTESTSTTDRYCVKCFSNASQLGNLSNILYDAVCNGYNNIYLVDVLAYDRVMNCINFTAFQIDRYGYVASWNTTIPLTDLDICSCNISKQYTKLFLFSTSYLGLIPGLTKLTFMSIQMHTYLLPVEEVLPSLKEVASRVSKDSSKDDSTSIVKCKRIKTVICYIEAKSFH